MVVDRSKDYILQLSNYLKKNLEKGYSLETLKISLLKQGYSRVAIENAALLLEKEKNNMSISSTERPEINYRVVNEEVPIESNEPGFFKKLLKKFFG